MCPCEEGTGRLLAAWVRAVARDSPEVRPKWPWVLFTQLALSGETAQGGVGGQPLLPRQPASGFTLTTGQQPLGASCRLSLRFRSLGPSSAEEAPAAPAPWGLPVSLTVPLPVPARRLGRPSLRGGSTRPLPTALLVSGHHRALEAKFGLQRWHFSQCDFSSGPGGGGIPASASLSAHLCFTVHPDS